METKYYGITITYTAEDLINLPFEQQIKIIEGMK